MKRLNVRFSEPLRAAIRYGAEVRGITMNQLVIEALESYLKDVELPTAEAEPPVQHEET